MHVEERHRLTQERREISTISQRGRGLSRVNCSVSNGQKPISNIPCNARPTETLLGHFSEPSAGRLHLESSQSAWGQSKMWRLAITMNVLCFVSMAYYSHYSNALNPRQSAWEKENARAQSCLVLVSFLTVLIKWSPAEMSYHEGKKRVLYCTMKMQAVSDIKN